MGRPDGRSIQANTKRTALFIHKTPDGFGQDFFICSKIVDGHTIVVLGDSFVGFNYRLPHQICLKNELFMVVKMWLSPFC